MLNVTRRSVLGALLAGAALLGAAGGFGPEDKKADTAKIGEAAPAFTLKDTDGKEQSLAQYKGKIVVLEWFNPECPYVVKHHELHTTMIDLAKKYDRNVVWLAVSTGKTADQAALAKAKTNWKMAYPVLLDPTGATGKAYGAKTTPHMFVINAQGVLAYKGAIDDNNSPTELGKVNHVEQAITQLIKGETVTTTETRPYGCSVKYGS